MKNYKELRGLPGGPHEFALPVLQTGGTKTNDYDMFGYATHHPIGAIKHFINPEKNHATDTYKRPTHMTFSDESKYSNTEHPGGHWKQLPDGTWGFRPTQWNIDNAGGKDKLLEWWNAPNSEGPHGNTIDLSGYRDGGTMYSSIDIPRGEFGGDQRLKGYDLPKAQTGWFDDVYSTLNPYNWGVNDYTDKGDFNTAYSSAKKKGEEEFMYNGKRYNTKYAGTPRQEVGAYGVSGYPIDKKSIDNPAQVNLYPSFGRYLPGHIAAAVGNNQASVNYSGKGNYPYGLNKVEDKGEKSFNVYGQDDLTFTDKVASLPTGDYMLDEEYKPSDWNLFTNNCADNVCDAFGIPRSKGIQTPKGAMSKIKEKYPTLDITGRSYEDYLELAKNIKSQPSDKILLQSKNLLGIASSPELKNTNIGKSYVISIQKALNKLGYDLPKSVKTNNTFDGVLGDETKQALEDWQNKQLKNNNLLPHNQTGNFKSLQTPINRSNINQFVQNQQGEEQTRLQRILQETPNYQLVNNVPEQGVINQAPERQSYANKAANVFANPVSALGYIARNQEIPDNMPRNNPYDYGIDAAKIALGVGALSSAPVVQALGTNIGGVAGLTGNNLANAYFAYESGKNAPNVVNQWKNVNNVSDVAGAVLNTGLTILGAFPLGMELAPGIRSAKQNLYRQAPKFTSLNNPIDHNAPSRGWGVVEETNTLPPPPTYEQYRATAIDPVSEAEYAAWTPNLRTTYNNLFGNSSFTNERNIVGRIPATDYVSGSYRPDYINGFAAGTPEWDNLNNIAQNYRTTGQNFTRQDFIDLTKYKNGNLTYNDLVFRNPTLAERIKGTIKQIGETTKQTAHQLNKKAGEKITNKFNPQVEIDETKLLEDINKLLEKGVGIKKSDVPIKLELDDYGGTNYKFNVKPDPTSDFVKTGDIRLHQFNTKPQTLTDILKNGLNKNIGYSKPSDFPLAELERQNPELYNQLKGQGLGAESMEAFKQALKMQNPNANLYSSTSHTGGPGYFEDKGTLRYLTEYLNGRKTPIAPPSDDWTLKQHKEWLKLVEPLKKSLNGQSISKAKVLELLNANPKLAPYGIRFRYKDGGDNIHEDNNGYWNPDNWGKPVKIGSNDITMKGVNQPLYGVSNTGDAQYMMPGQDYKFHGDSVIEYPVMQNGGVPEYITSNYNDYINRMKAKTDSSDIYNLSQDFLNKNKKQMGGDPSVPNVGKQQVNKAFYNEGGELSLPLSVYQDYVNGVYNNTPVENYAKSVFEKMNRVHLKDAKKNNMTVPNYIMSNINKKP